LNSRAYQRSSETNKFNETDQELSSHYRVRMLSAEQMRLKDSLAMAYGDMVHEGRVLDPAARDIEAFFLSSQKRVTGEVYVTLRAGSAFVDGAKSPWSLHAASRSIYGEEARDWSPADARGFTAIRSLPGVLQARAAGAGR
jgi:argininosuccinate synthase